LGGGIYNSPSSALSMLAVKPTERGQSSGLRMMMSMVANAFSIVICFDLIVGKLDPALVYKLFIVGGGGLSDETLAPFMDGFHAVIWILVAMNIVACLLSLPIQDFKRPKPASGASSTAVASIPSVPSAEGTALKELVQKEGQPVQDQARDDSGSGHLDHVTPEPGQPEPLEAPLEGLDANPKEDAAIIEAMEKAEVMEKAEEIELQTIAVHNDSTQNSSAAPGVEAPKLALDN